MQTPSCDGPTVSMSLAHTRKTSSVCRVVAVAPRRPPKRHSLQLYPSGIFPPHQHPVLQSRCSGPTPSSLGGTCFLSESRQISRNGRVLQRALTEGSSLFSSVVLKLPSHHQLADTTLFQVNPLQAQPQSAGGPIWQRHSFERSCSSRAEGEELPHFEKASGLLRRDAAPLSMCKSVTS